MTAFDSAADLVVDARGVTKSFGRTVALAGLDLQVARGEVHGFLGPNGAGKTTTLRILLGLLRIDGGTVRLLGGDPWRDATTLHRRLAYVPGDVSLWPNLSGGEVIDLLSRLQGGHDTTRRDRYLDLFDLDPTKKCRAYSRGNRQKVALISALATDADLYLFDEPTAGLDPLKEAAFRTCVQELRGEGRTVLLSSHILSEAEALSDRVSIIRDGKLVESGRLDQLRHLTRTSVSAEVTDRPARPRRDRGRARPGRGGPPRHRPGRARGAGRPAPGAERGRGHEPDQSATEPRGAVPPPLRSRPGPPADRCLIPWSAPARCWGWPSGVTAGCCPPGSSASPPWPGSPPPRRQTCTRTSPNGSWPPKRSTAPRHWSPSTAGSTTPTSLGSLSLIKLTAFGAAMVAVLMVVVTIRHTRAEEAAGRLELLGAGVVGRDAPLAAALALTFGASVVLGLVTAGALVGAGLPATGALAFGLSWAAAGIAFSAVAAVAARSRPGAGPQRLGHRHGGRRLPAAGDG